EPERKSSPVVAPARKTFDRGMENRIWKAWARGETDDNAVRFAAAEYGLPLNRPAVELFNLSTGGSTSGAELVPQAFFPAVERKLKYIAPLRDWVTVYPTASGELMKVSRIDWTSNMAATLSEGSSDTTNDDNSKDPVTASVDSTVSDVTTGFVNVTYDE